MKKKKIKSRECGNNGCKSLHADHYYKAIFVNDSIFCAIKLIHSFNNLAKIVLRQGCQTGVGWSVDSMKSSSWRNIHKRKNE